MKLVISSKFTRQVEKLLKKQPGLRSDFDECMWLMKHNIGSPSIRVHKLKGKGDLWAVSVAPNIRIVFQWEGEELFLLKIGSHDEVY